MRKNMTSGGNNFNDYPENGDGGTAISRGGTPNTGCGTPFRLNLITGDNVKHIGQIRWTETYFSCKQVDCHSQKHSRQQRSPSSIVFHMSNTYREVLELT